MSDITFLLLVTATVLNGILTGASLDQSIKQLPARHRIGVIAYSVYAQASELGNGIVWYAMIGIGAALLSIGAAVAACLRGTNASQALPLYIAAVLSLLHSFATTQAAPTMFSQRRHQGDEAALTIVFNRFERWQTIRVIFQLLTFTTLIWGMIVFQH